MATCSADACCVPISLANDDLRVFLLDNVLYFDSFARLETADGREGAWEYEIEVTAPGVGTFDCQYGRGDFVSEGAWLGCSEPLSGAVFCGEEIVVEVRLASSTFDSRGQLACSSGLEHGPVSRFSVQVECAVCPDQVEPNLECNYPFAGSCEPTVTPPDPQSYYGACACRGPADATEPRVWECSLYETG